MAPDHSLGLFIKNADLRGIIRPFTWKSGDFKKNKKNACNHAKIYDIIFETLQLGDSKDSKESIVSVYFYSYQ